MANLEDLKKAWQSQSAISQQRFDQIGSKVSDSTELLQTTIFRRDMRETFASVVVVAAFSFYVLCEELAETAEADNEPSKMDLDHVDRCCHIARSWCRLCHHAIL